MLGHSVYDKAEAKQRPSWKWRRYTNWLRWKWRHTIVSLRRPVCLSTKVNAPCCVAPLTCPPNASGPIVENSRRLTRLLSSTEWSFIELFSSLPVPSLRFSPGSTATFWNPPFEIHLPFLCSIILQLFVLCRLRRQGPLSPMAVGVATEPRSEVTWQRRLVVSRSVRIAPKSVKLSLSLCPPFLFLSSYSFVRPFVSKIQKSPF